MQHKHHSDTLGNTNRPPPYSYMDAIYRACTIHAFLFCSWLCGCQTLVEKAMWTVVLLMRMFCSPLSDLFFPILILSWWIIWFLLLLRIGLPCVFTLPLFFSPFSGDGDKEHALLSHGVCQEWGDLWWVTQWNLSILQALSRPADSHPPYISCTK